MGDLAHIKIKMDKNVCPKVNSITVNGVEFGDKAESVVLVVAKGMPKAILTLMVDEIDVDGHFEKIEHAVTGGDKDGEVSVEKAGD